jgi:hypothetical protein
MRRWRAASRYRSLHVVSRCQPGLPAVWNLIDARGAESMDPCPEPMEAMTRKRRRDLRRGNAPVDGSTMPGRRSSAPTSASAS